MEQIDYYSTVTPLRPFESKNSVWNKHFITRAKVIASPIAITKEVKDKGGCAGIPEDPATELYFLMEAKYQRYSHLFSTILILTNGDEYAIVRNWNYAHLRLTERSKEPIHKAISDYLSS